MHGHDSPPKPDRYGSRGNVSAGGHVHIRTLRCRPIGDLDAHPWDETTPSGTDVEFQIATTDNPLATLEFLGPDETGDTWFSTATGEDVPDFEGRHCAYLTLSFSGDNPSSTRGFSYDGSGNMISRTAETAGENTITEVRDDDSWPSEDRINALNQIIRNDVTVGTVLTSWYRAKDASGNMTSKTLWAPITGDVSNGSDVVSNVSAGNIARVSAGDDVRHAAFAPGTMVSSVGSTSFRVSNIASASATGTTVLVFEVRLDEEWRAIPGGGG